MPAPVIPLPVEPPGDVEAILLKSMRTKAAARREAWERSRTIGTGETMLPGIDPMGDFVDPSDAHALSIVRARPRANSRKDSRLPP
jgi:hypothetical protein